MPFPYYVSPEQMMQDKAEYAQKGIAKGRSIIVLEYQDGIFLFADNPSSSLNKISEIYDRIAFAGAGKYSEFENLVSTKPHKRSGNAGRIAYRFTTRSLPALTEIYRKFYTSGKKIIPDNLKIYPISLAVWFMDDGCKSYRAIYLNTQKFNINEQYQLASLLKQQFDIQASLNKDKKYYRLRIAVSSVGKFLNVIRPYLLPMFCYKTP